ncbi:hypothetical protein C2845_PM15G23530 [Panicum miliaceum]|uniref:Uncharacterized protein n=1 Tax=Panicum miliaceum TaxID=4540 RepID=A0A3L6QAN6_PANMI|nr:hypothetical protein C2845_PM15G23530 [Panicum miliaceum]
MVGGEAPHGSARALSPASRREARQRDGRRPLPFVGGHIWEDAATPAEACAQQGPLVAEASQVRPGKGVLFLQSASCW